MRTRLYIVPKKGKTKRSILLKKVVQFCLTSGVVAMPWMAQAQNFGVGGYEQLISNEQLNHIYTSSTTSLGGEYSKWATDSKSDFISDDNCVMFHGYRFKIVGVDGTGANAKVTLWSYDTDFGSTLYCDENTISFEPDKSYAKSILRQSMDKIYRDVFESDKLIQSVGLQQEDLKIHTIKHRQRYSHNKTKISEVDYTMHYYEDKDVTETLNAYVWAPSKKEVLLWRGSNNDSIVVDGLGSSWLRTPYDVHHFNQSITAKNADWAKHAADIVGTIAQFSGALFTVEFVAHLVGFISGMISSSSTDGYYVAYDGYYVGSDGKIYSNFEKNSSHVISIRPAIQILNQHTYVFTANGDLNTDGVFAADSAAGMATKYYKDMDGSVLTSDSQKITLDGSKVKVNADIADASVKIGGLLTTETNNIDTWDNLNGSSANIAYMAICDNKIFDLQGIVQNQQYSLKVFGIRGNGVTELKETEFKNLSLGTDGKTHLQIGSVNQGASVTLANEAVVDLNANCNKGAGYYIAVEAGSAGRLNLETYKYGDKISNSGTLILDGTYNDVSSRGIFMPCQLLGTGTLEIDGDITFAYNGVAIGGDIIINSGKTLRNSSIVTANITNNGTYYALAEYMGKGLVNNGTLMLNGGHVALQKQITGTNGIIRIEKNEVVVETGSKITGQTIIVDNGQSITVEDVNSLDGTDNLVLSKGDMNIESEDGRNVVSLGNFSSTENGKLIFTADLGSVANNVAKSDYLNVTNIGAATVLQVDGINLLNGNQIKAGEKITVVKASAEQLNNLTLDGIIHVSVEVGGTEYDFQFVQDASDRGALVAQQTSEITLPEVVQNIAGQGIIATYAFTSDYTVPGDLGTLTRVDAGTPRELTINGNNHNLFGNNKTGITVNSGDTLNLVDIETMRLFSSGADVITTAGTVNIDNSKVFGNVSVQSTGVLNAAADSVYNGVIKNDGIVNLRTGELSGNISGAGTLNIEGVVNAGQNKVTQSKLVVLEDSSFSIYTKNIGITDTGLSISNTIENNGVVTINSFGQGGVYDSLLTLDATVTGSGTLVINGAKVQLNSNVENKISVNNVSGELTIAAGNIGDSVAMSNYAKVVLLDGTLADGHTIRGKGSMKVAGNVTARVQDLAVEEGISINQDKKLTLTGSGILTTEVNGLGILVVAGNLIALNKISNNIEINENNNLVIGLKTLIKGKTVTGAGSLIIGTDEVNINLPDIAVTGGIYNDYAAIVTGNGSLTCDLQGNGSLQISGIVNAGGHKVDQDNLTIYSGGSLTINGSNLLISNNITNFGTLNLSGGILGVVVEGSNGQIVISGDVTIESEVNNTVNIEATGSLKAGADSLLKPVTNRGTYNVMGGKINSEISAGMTPSIQGKLNIEEDTEVLAKISYQDITVAKDAKLKVTKYLDTTDSLTLNGTLDLGSDDCSTNLIIGTLHKANDVDAVSELYIHADIAGAGTAKSDSVTVTVIDENTVLAIDGINILVEDDMYSGERIEVIKSSEEQLAHLTLKGSTTVLSSGCKYTFVQDTSATANRGTLIGTKDGSVVYTLPKVIQNNVSGSIGTETIDTYSLVGDYHTPADLGTLTRAAGTPSVYRTLTIEGNGHSLDGAGYAGVTVNMYDSLIFNNLKEIRNFNGDVITTAGYVGVNNSTIIGNVSVTDNGVILFDGTELRGNLTTKNNGIVLTINGGKITGAITIEKETAVVTTPSNLAGMVSNDGTLLLYDGGELKADVRGNGSLLISGGTIVFSGDVIENKVIIDEDTVFDPEADVFKDDVENNGTLELDGGTLSGTGGTLVSVTNNSGSILKINKPVTLGENSKIVMGDGSILQIAADKFTAEQTAAVKAGNAALNGIDNMNKLNINDTATIKMTGNTTNGGYYVLLGGSAIKDIINYSKFKNILLEDSRITRTRWFETDDALALQVNFTTEAELNVLGLAGVQQGMISMNNQTADAVTDHLSLMNKKRQENGSGKEVWASYIHSKDNVQGLKSGSYGNNYSGQYNGTTVGVDLVDTPKIVTGVAVTYATGKTNGSGADAQIRNESKYYGLSFYNRVANDSNAVITDLGFIHGKNELSTIQSNGSEANAKVNSVTLGVKIEREISLKGSKLVPFAGVRYLHLQNRDFTNNKNLNYTTDNQNLIIPKLGLAWSGEYKMTQSKWTAKPKMEFGYLWNLGNRNADVMTNVNGYPLDTNFDVTDKSSYFAKLGIDFVCRNFMAGLGYSYMKGDAVRGNRWNVNVSWQF